MATHAVAIVALASVALAADGALGKPMSTSKPKRVHCGRAEIVVHGRLRGSRLRVHGARGPVVACLKVSRRLDGPAAKRATAAQVRDRSWLSPALRRLAHWTTRARRLGGVVGRGLAKRLVAARAARAIDQGPLPPDMGDRVKGGSWSVRPDPDELGSGVGVDATAEVSQGRARGSVRRLEYEGSFVKRCPDARGDATGDYEYRVLTVTTYELAGRRRIESEEYRVKAKFVGHVNDDARVTVYDLEGEAVVEAKGREENAGTGRLLHHAPTQVYRGTFAFAGIDPRAPGSLGDALRAGRFTGTLRGPRGAGVPEAIVEKKWGIAIILATAGLHLDGASASLLKAEQYWYGDSSARDPDSREPGNCVELEIDPEPVKVAPGETKPVHVLARAKADHAEVVAKHHADPPFYSQVSPADSTSAPGAPAVFDYTAPSDRFECVYDAFDDIASSKRGRAKRTAKAETPPLVRAYVGSARGEFRLGTLVQSWAATGLRFARLAAGDYELREGVVTWSLTGTTDGGSCRLSAGPLSFPAARPDVFDINGTTPRGDLVWGFGGYSIVANYSKQVPASQTCPWGSEQTQSIPYPTWLNTRGVQPADPGDALSGSATNDSVSYSWDLHPQY